MSRRELVDHFVSIALVAAGAAGVIAFLASLDPTDTAGANAWRLAGAAATLAATLVVLIRLHRRATLRDTRGRRLEAEQPGRIAWATAACGVAIGLLATTFLLTAAVEVAASATRPTEASDDGQTDGERAFQRALERSTAGVEGESANEGTGSARPDIIGPQAVRSTSTAVTKASIGNLLSDEPVLRIVPANRSGRSATDRGVMGPGVMDPTTMDPRLVGRSLHLRGFVIDSLDETATWHERGGTEVTITDAGDGTVDGWLTNPFDEVAATAPGNAGIPLEIDVEFIGQSNGLVFAPSRLLAVNDAAAPTGAARLQPGSTSLSLGDVQRYALRCELPSVPLSSLRKSRARGSLPLRDRALRLPRGGERTRLAMRSIESYARSITHGARTDADRVLQIITHLREEFGYELYDVGFLSPVQCQQLINRGSGSCTHFASLAALALRSVGIPTRIAAGYVAREPLPDEAGWLVRARDGHAWVEVHFENYGWLHFDPTPGDTAIGGAEQHWSPVQDDQSGVASESRAARTSTIGRYLVDASSEVSRALLALASRTPIAFALLLAGAALLACALRRQRLQRAPHDDGDAEAESPLSPESPVPAVAALLAAAEARGHRQPRAATPMEFARRVERTDEQARGFADAMRAVLGRVCTGTWQRPGDEERVRSMTVTLLERQDPSQTEPVAPVRS